MEELMHSKKRRKKSSAGLRKARCVRSCRSGKLRARQPKSKTLAKCRRRCHVKAK